MRLIEIITRILGRKFTSPNDPIYKEDKLRRSGFIDYEDSLGYKKLILDLHHIEFTYEPEIGIVSINSDKYVSVDDAVKMVEILKKEIK